MSFSCASSPQSAPVVFVLHHDESNTPSEIRHLSTITAVQFDIYDILAFTADATPAQFHPLWYGQLVRDLVLEIYEAVLSFPRWNDDPDRALALADSLHRFQTTLLHQPSRNFQYSHVTHPNVRFDHDWLFFLLDNLHHTNVRSPPHESTRPVFFNIHFVGPAYAILESLFHTADSDILSATSALCALRPRHITDLQRPLEDITMSGASVADTNLLYNNLDIYTLSGITPAPADATVLNASHVTIHR